MNEFEYNYEEEEFLFSLPSHHLIEIGKNLNFSRKKNHLFLSVKFGSCINIKTTDNCYGENYPSYDIPIFNFINYPSYDCEIPSEYYDFPTNRKISIKWDKKLISRFNYKPTNVNIKLAKNSIEFLFPNYHFIFVGELEDNKILYENVLDVNQIENILKISSLGILRIYYDKNLPLLFSATSGSAHNISVSPNMRWISEEVIHNPEPRIFKSYR